METKTDRETLRRYIVWVAGGVLALTVLVFAFAFLVVGNPRTCASCHKTDYQRFTQTAHEKFPCETCHEPPGVTRRVRMAGSYLRMIFVNLTQGTQNVRVTEGIGNDRCQTCHVPWRQISPSGDLRLPHRTHYDELKLECTYCHARVAHMGEIRGRLTTQPPMTLCMQCHNGKKKINGKVATNECKACHTEKPVPETHLASNWFEDHGVIAQSEQERAKCANCHAYVLDFCRACHQNKRPSTHVGGEQWKSLHRDRAQARPKTCVNICHSKNFCLRCHDEGLFAVRLKGKL